jgi:hypothetical protein
MEETDVKKYLENLSFPYSLPQSSNYEYLTLEQKIFQCLVGSARSSRLGPAPSLEVTKIICSNIKEQIKKGLPIQIVSAWGAKKTIIGVDQRVDIAEYFTLLQYLTIAKEIQDIYPPGVQYNIFVGDAYYEYLYGRNQDVYRYLSDLEDLVNVFDVKCFKLFSLEKFHQKDCGLITQCNSNYEALYRYWVESSAVLEDEWIKLESYKNLCQNGWVGIISSAMREHYLKRLNILFPHFSGREKIEAVIRFFSYSMMVSQNDLFGRKDPSRCTADFCLLRVPPPGIPKALYENRLRKRIIPAKFFRFYYS